MIKQSVKSILTDSMVQVEPTRLCNFHCTHCNHRNENGCLELDKYREILAQHKDCDVIKLQGLGEPLLHPQIQDLIDMAKDAGHRVMVITNGSQPYVKNVDYYVFSLETVSPDIFEGLGKHNLTGILENIRFAALKQQVTLNCVQCSSTKPSDVEAVRSFAKELGANIWLTPQEVWVDRSHPDYDRQVTDTKRAWEIHGVSPTYQKYRICTWGRTDFYYDYTGVCHPCCIRMTDEYKYKQPSEEVCANCPL